MKALICSILIALVNTTALCAVDNDCIFEEAVPSGIVLQDCGYGLGLFASKPFKVGDIIYKQSYTLIDDEEREFLLRTDQGDFTLTTTTHSVIMGNGRRALYFFDAHINHSCDPNSLSVTTPEMSQACEYYQVATKDIQVGEQITCDYNLFDYDCRNKNITECHCGSSLCRNQIFGFKYLPLDEQIRLLPFIDKSIVQQFAADHPDYAPEGANAYTS